MLICKFKKMVSSMGNLKQNELKLGSIKICLIYLIIGFSWIYFSDRVVSLMVSNKNVILVINTYKGWFYVLITAIVIYFLIVNFLKKIYTVEKKLKDSNEELQTTNKELQAYFQQLMATEQEIRTQYNLMIESEEKYKTLVNQMQLGLALYEGKTNEDVRSYHLIDANDSHERITGLVKKQVLGKSIYQIFSDMNDENASKLQHTINTGDSMHYESYQKDRGVYYEIISYKPKDYQLAILVNDITQRKKAEEAIAVSENNFRSIFQNSSDAIMIIFDNMIIDCNSATLQLLGFHSKESVLGKSSAVFSPEVQPDGMSSKDKVFIIHEETIKNGKSKFEWWYQRADMSLVPVEVVMTIIMYDGKEVFHSLCRDISERKILEDRLTYMGNHDQLTGLYNRRFFESELIRLDDKKSLPLTITMADINGLKLINDSFGHAVGDELLIKVAEILTKGCRSKDTVFRLSGDEFVIMSPNTDGFEIKKIIDDIRTVARNEKIGMVDISVSFGYETKNTMDESLLETLKKAEDFMYSKKLYESPSMRGRTIHAIITTLQEKNKREEEHSLRVSELCESMGIALGLYEEEIMQLKTVGRMHDIGKIAIDDTILNKKGGYTSEEWKEMKRHPEIGYRILSTVNELSEMAEFVLAHHERWDGKGYPKGIKEEEIPRQSRIIAIADAYDAMTSERSYRNAITKEAAIQELIHNAGSQFDSYYVKIFIDKVLQSSKELLNEEKRMNHVTTSSNI